MKNKSVHSQKKKFIEIARALGCDESEAAFTQKLKAITSVKPMTNAGVKKKARKK